MRKCILAMLVCVPACAQPAMNLTLDEARKLALQNNPRVSSARSLAAAAYQIPNEYRAAIMPVLTGNVTGVGADNGSRLAAGGLNNPVVYDRVGTGLTATQLITDFGRTGNLIQTARLRAQAQDQFVESTRANVLLSVGTQYFAILKAQAVLRVATDTVRARQLVVDQISALADSKLRSTLDVSFAKVNLSDAKLLQVQAQNALSAAQARLASAMGLPAQTAFVPAEEPLPSEMPEKVADLIAEAIQNRPELKDLRLQQNAAERFVKAEHSLYFPTVAVTGNAGFVPGGVEQVPGKYGAIGMNISIPVFNGGLYRARQTEAELRARAARDSVSDLQNRVIGDVRVAYLDAVTAHDRMALTGELLQQAQLARDLAQSRFDLGLGSIVELSQADLNLTSAEIAEASARYDYQALRVIVDFQVGR